MSRSIAARGAMAVVTAATAFGVVVPAAPAHAATTVAVAVWNAPFGGGSRCSQIAATTVRCDHNFHSYTTVPPSHQTRQETCSLGRASTVPGADTSTCAATLVGRTSGPGKLVTESGAVCDTTGIGTMAFHIDTILGPYDLASSTKTVNNEVVSHITAEEISTDGLYVQKLDAYWTGGCGVNTSGAFWGRWTLTVV